jgi:hypothetical protein
LALGDSGELTDYDPGRLVVLTLVPPHATLDPPAVFALIVEQDAATAAHLVFELDLRVLLHIYLDYGAPLVVPPKKG